MGFQTALLIGVGAVFCTHGLNRFLGERNYRRLSPEEKVKLVDQFSAYRSAGTYLPIAIMGVVILVTVTYPGAFWWLFPTGVVAVLGVSLVLQVLIFQRLASLNLPEEFVSRYRFQAIACLVGNIVAMSFLTFGILRLH